MLIAMFLIMYVFLGVATAAYLNHDDKVNDRFVSDREEERRSVLFICISWPFFLVWYFMMKLYDKIYNFFDGIDSKGDK